ncbi:MAG: hypothetical protein RMZ95_013905 [Nostoc sp. DedQUE07]
MKKLWHLPFQGHDNWKLGVMFDLMHRPAMLIHRPALLLKL